MPFDVRPDQEIKKLYEIIIDKNGLLILHYLVAAKNNPENIRYTELIAEDFDLLIKKHPDRRFNVLVDITDLKKTPYVGIEAAKIYIRLAGHKQINKIAAASKNIVIKSVVQFIVKSINKENDFQWFDTKEKAINWLLNN